MNASHPVSLLIAALVMLHHPCRRSQATATLLLNRAAQHDALSAAEREACQNLIDDLEREAMNDSRGANETWVGRTARLSSAAW